VEFERRRHSEHSIDNASVRQLSVAGCRIRLRCQDARAKPHVTADSKISASLLQPILRPRSYLSDVSYGGHKHLFIAVVYPNNPRDMNRFLPDAEKLIATVQVPATPG
jgi:hypothetical protein